MRKGKRQAQLLSALAHVAFAAFHAIRGKYLQWVLRLITLLHE